MEFDYFYGSKTSSMDWIEHLDVAVTATNAKGDIIYMNEKAGKTFLKQGGKALVGSRLSSCHSERSNEIIEKIIRTKSNNVYTIEKDGKKKLIFQSPVMVNGSFTGLVELGIEIPFEMPHFVRE